MIVVFLGAREADTHALAEIVFQTMRAEHGTDVSLSSHSAYSEPTEFLTTISSLQAPLALVTSRAELTEADRQIYASATHAVVCYDSEVDATNYLRFVEHLGISLAAMIRISESGESTPQLDRDDVLRAVLSSSHHGYPSVEQPAVRALCLQLGNRLKTSNYRVLPVLRRLIAVWQESFGDEVTVTLDGSVVSDTRVITPDSVIDVDIRFNVDNPDTPGLIGWIEQLTGLSYRKTIEVNDWPTGMSKAHMIEKKLILPGVPNLIDIEGCLRNRRGIDWHPLYLQLFSAAELERYRLGTLRLKAQPEVYRQLKQTMRTVARDRALERGIGAV